MDKNTEYASRPGALGVVRTLFAFLIWTLAGGVPLPAFAGDPGVGPSPSPAAGHHEPAGHAGGEKRAAARVNGVEISMDSVIATAYQINAKKIRSGHAADPAEEVKKEALHQLIIQELAYQKAKAMGIRADEEAIAGELANFRKRVGGEEKFKEFLDKSRMTEGGLRALAERKIVIETILAREVTAKVSVSEEDVKTAYERDKNAYGTPEKILITNVVFFLNTDDKEALKKAEAVLDSIKADKDANPWNATPDDTFAIRDIEVKQDEEPELYAAAKKLQKGELSGILKTSDSLQIIKLREYQPSVQLSFEQTKTSIEKKLREEARQKRMHEWEAELEKDAKVEILEIKGE